MDKKQNNAEMTKRKIVGLMFLLVFSLAFVFACLKKVLPVGAWIVGTFGFMFYPMCLVFAFISLAVFLGFSYRRNSKPVTYFVIALFSILLAIHSIKTYKSLDSVVRFAHLKNYLNLSYDKLTIVGSFGSILCGVISMFLGGMGTIVLFVIFATIFAGLLLDYEIYGKYHDEHIKKLKSKKIRDKVANSDKNISAGGIPNYSFEQSSDSQVAGVLTVDANSYESNLSDYSNNKASSYNQAEVLDEIIVDGAGNVNVSGDIGNLNDFAEPQTKNSFATDFYKTENIPDVYSSEMDDYRRQFMNATFGTTAATSQDVDSLNTNYWNDSETDDVLNSLSNFTDETNSTNSDAYSDQNELIEDDFAKFLNTTENNNIETEVNNDVTSLFGQTETTKDIFGGFSSDSSNTLDNVGFGSKVEEIDSQINRTRYGSGFNPVETSQIKPVEKPHNFEPSFPSQGFASGIVNNKRTNMQPVNESKNRFVSISEIGMPGVRYNKPVLSLLRMPIPDNGDYTAEQNRKTALLENVLSAFNIKAKVVNIVRGPKITRFELALPLGTSVRKIPSYEDDIAAALAAKTITIKAPIPGSPYVGIELENDTFTTVYQRELLESDAFQNCKDPLPIAIGKDISGEIVVRSLVDMVHLLIAGSTGSGKSVFIHNIVLSLIFKSSPDDLRLIMIDPKKVEFPIYNGLPHLLTPEVVAGSQKALNALKWCVKEMDRRYELMAKAGFNNIKPYNKSDIVKAGQFEKLPYIVIIVDELAEVMMANKKEAEACIQRITQLARACGMHMVLATQRPSVDIITGVIKNNIPSRIAFSLQSGIDSKTILTTVGAEKLLGKGDMIFAPTGTSAWPRLQASYATDEEIKSVIDYTIKNNYANYDEAVEKAMEADSSSDDSGNISFSGGDGLPPQKDALDSYFKVALKMVMQNGGASTSYLQRRLSIGYSRAAKIMDQMSDKGYIAQANGSKQRKILITPEMFREEFGEDYDSID